MPDPTRVPQRAATRRETILRTARQLFSAHGIGPVTTNQIAREAGISPGNLYYWFGSKEEIVRNLFSDWSARMQPPDDPTQNPQDALQMLWQRVTEQPQPDEDYAFFLRELFVLLHTDPLLAESYRAGYATRLDHFVALVERLAEAGLLRTPEPPTTVRDTVGLLWLVSETALPFAEAVHDQRVDARRYGRAVMQPLLTTAGRELLGVDEPVKDLP